MQFKIVETMEGEKDGLPVTDQRVHILGRRRSKRYPGLLRVVTIQKPDGEIFQFLTNNMRLAPSTIAAAYKDRWEIESFFKTLKQNLRIKSFLSTSPNAVLTQIWTAVIAMLLVRYLQVKARYNWSFSNLMYFLRMNLFVYRDLWEWLHNPFIPPDVTNPPTQLVLTWN